jgi:ABC-type enterochelin transport system permease subunit
MARIKLKARTSNSTHFQAFTIVETLTAMVLISIAFGIGILVFLNVTENRSITQEEQYQLIVENIRTTTFEKEDFRSQKYRLDNFVVVKLIRPYQGIENLYQLSIQLFDEQQEVELFVRKEIFFLADKT